MSSYLIHPCELSYAFTYAKTDAVIGWGAAPFMPTQGDDGALADWLTDGEARLIAAGRLIGNPEDGLNFTDEITSVVMALVDPGLVLVAERKDGEGVRRLSVHVAGVDFVGLTRLHDGMFEITRYTDLTAAAGACVGFVGASLAPLKTQARVTANQKLLAKLQQVARAGQTPEATAVLVKLGMSEPDAASALHALTAPAAAGVLNVFYCAGNAVQDAEPFTVMTNVDDETWALFAPADLDGPMILEQSSVSALTARVSVGIAARLSGPA